MGYARASAVETAPGGRSGLLSDTGVSVQRHRITRLSNSDTPKSQHHELRKGLIEGAGIGHRPLPFPPGLRKGLIEGEGDSDRRLEGFDGFLYG